MLFTLFNLLGTKDAEKVAQVDPQYKKVCRRLLRKAQKLWNSQNQSAQTAEAIEAACGSRLIVPVLA